MKFSFPKLTTRGVLRFVSCAVLLISLGFTYHDLTEKKRTFSEQIKKVRDPLEVTGLLEEFSHSVTADFMLAFLSFIFVGLVEYMRERMETEEALTKIREDITSVLGKIDNTVECRYLGVAHKTLDEIVERFGRAEEVKNTFIVFALPSQLEAYSHEHFEKLGTAIKSFLT